MKTNELKIQGYDSWNECYYLSSDKKNMYDFFRMIKLLKDRGNDVTLYLYTGFKDKNGNDIYFGDKVKEWMPDEMEDEGGYWWEAEVKQVNGCAVLMEIGFDYSDSKFPDDYIFLYENVTKIELAK